MTIEQAFQNLISSEEYKKLTKLRDSTGGKYRLYASRYNKKELKTGAMVELLIAHGYKVTATKATKK